MSRGGEYGASMALGVNVMLRSAYVCMGSLAIAVVLLVGCGDGNFAKNMDVAVKVDNDQPATPPAEGTTPPADTGNAAPTAPAPEQTTGTAKAFKFTENSDIFFEGSKTIDTHGGGFEKFDGTITIPDNDPLKAKINLTIDMTSIFSDNRILTGVLKGEEWFSIDAFPTSTFTSTAIEQDGDRYKVTGDLVIKGKSQTISFPAKVDISEGTITGEAEFVVDRTWWSVGYSDWKGELIKNEVVLSLVIDAVADQSV